MVIVLQSQLIKKVEKEKKKQFLQDNIKLAFGGNMDCSSKTEIW